MPQQNQQHLLGLGLGLTDFKEMFDLSEEDLTKSILEFYAGPTNFKHATQNIADQVTTIDDAFNQSPDEIAQFIKQQIKALENYLDEHQDKLTWDKFANPKALVEYRKHQLNEFLSDYQHHEQNYHGQPDSILDEHFDLALVSHYLFGEHSDDLDFHLQTLQLLTNLSNEIRIFPLLDHQGNISKLVGPVSLALQQLNFGVEIREVKYHLQNRGNAMLRVWLQECVIE